MDGEPIEANKVGTRGMITTFIVRTRTVTPPGIVLELVLEGAAPANQVRRMNITEETGVRKGTKSTTPPHHTNI